MERQKSSWLRADGVYLISSVAAPRGEPVSGRILAVLKGSANPGQLSMARGCWPDIDIPAGVLQIVFVEGAGTAEAHSFDAIRPDDVTEPEIVARLRALTDGPSWTE
jgi:hypothetical protein